MRYDARCAGVDSRHILVVIIGNEPTLAALIWPTWLICRTGNRTRTLARYLVEQMGYTQVFNVRDGITRWISDDKPVKRL